MMKINGNTEYSPYSYCNNSPMMWRDPSGLASEMEIVDKCAVVANSLIDFWGDIPDNCVLPNKKRTGIDDGQGGSNGYSRSIISKSKNASNQFTVDNGHMNGNARGPGHQGSGYGSGHGGGGGGNNGNSNTELFESKSKRNMPEISKLNNPKLQGIRTPGHTITPSNPFLGTALGIISQSKEGRKMLSEIDYMNDMLGIQTPLRAKPRSYFDEEGYPDAAGLNWPNSYNLLNFVTIAPIIDVDITAASEGSVDIKHPYGRKDGIYKTTTFILIDILAHELGHLHHFLSIMTDNPIFGHIIYKSISKEAKESYTNDKLNAIRQELKILGITY